MPDPIKPVNLPFSPPDLVGEYRSAYSPDESNNSQNLDYHSIFDSLLSSNSSNDGTDFSTISAKEVPMSGRFPKYFPGMDNEEMYAQAQTGLDKAYNGVVKMTGTAAATFIEGTAGLVYGIGKSVADRKFSSFYDNELTNSLNDWTTTLEDSYAHYKTERERNGNWWEPSNLFTGNFLWDGIVKNLGFSLGAAAAGFAWGGALQAIGLTGKIMGAGAKMAARADAIISEAALLPEVERLSSINSKLKSLLGEVQSGVGKGLMKADQAVVATFGTVGEAGLEALHNSKEFRKTLIDDFINTYGYTPGEADLEKINKSAESVGNWSFGLNTALLTATNYVQLPKIYSSSFKAEKGILNNVALEGEKYASTLPEKGFGKLYYKAKNIAGLFVNKEEGFEEGAQFAIQTGTQNYFNNKYRGKETSALDDGLLYGVKEALTTGEGTLNIFTGSFSGALQSSGVLGVKNYMPVIGQTGKIGERGITGYGGTDAVERNDAVNALNKSMIKDKLKEAYSNVKAAEVIQQDREAAIRQGDILESKDLEFDYAHNFITTRLKYNAKNAIDNEIKDLKQQAATDFEKLKQQGTATDIDTVESFTARLNNLQKHADSTARMYEDANIKYKGLVDKETGKRLYTDDVIDKLVYAGAKVLDYDNRIPQLNIPLASAGIITSDILSDIITTGLPKEEVVAKAIDDIKALDVTNSDELITNLKDIIEVALRRKQFIEEYKEIKNTPIKFQEKKEVETVIDKTVPKGVITIKTKNGDRDIEIGEEYFLGKITEYDKQGRPVYRAPRVKVLGKNEDGTIQLQDVKTGAITNVKPEKLEDYKLGKVADATKKDLWLNDNANMIFVHRRLKDNEGKYRTGQIENHPQDGMMYFVYTNEKGKVVKIPVSREMFVPKPGTNYKRGVIAPKTKLIATAQQTLEQIFGEKEEVTPEQVTARNAFLASLYEKGIGRINRINEKLENNKKTLDNLSIQLEEKREELTTTKKGTLRKSGFGPINKTISELLSLKDNLEDENNSLNNEKAELEYIVPLIEETITELSEFKDDNSSMIAKMKSDIELLEDLINITGEAISKNEGLLKAIDKLFSDAMDTFNDYIKLLQDENPDLPTIYFDEYKDSLEKYYGEEGAAQIIMDKRGFTERILQLESAINSFSDELNIPNLNTNADKLVEDIRELNEGIDSLINEQIARRKILEKFEKYVNEKEQLQEEEEKISTNSKVITAALKTADKTTVQNRESNPDYEPDARKPTNIIPRATQGIDRGKPHQDRAKKFGANLESFENRKDIRGVYVTASNEAELIPGLMEQLTIDERGAIDESIDKNQIVTMVMVNTKGELLGEDGQVLTEDQLADAKNYAVYQVYPDSKFQWGEEYDNASMFRKNTSEEVIKAITKKYTKWKNDLLESTIIGEQHQIAASFGIPELVVDAEGETDYSTRTSAKDAGLVTEDELEGKQMLSIPTTSDKESQGLVTYMNALGKVFLKKTNGVVPLQNRKHTEQEAATIYEALVQLSKNMMDPKEGINGNKSVRLLQYLRSVVYWGVPVDAQNNRKKAGYNSIFFEKDKKTGNLMLSISKDGLDVKFTPSELALHKGDIINKIKDLHVNVNSSRIKKINDSFEQIISIAEDGTIKDKIVWPNYQTYLLSDKMPDENGKISNKSKVRKADAIPLTTVMRPLVNAEDTNRKAIYFYTTDTADDYAFEDIKQTKALAPKGKITAGKISKEEEQEEEEVSEGIFIKGNKVVNEYETPGGIGIRFTVEKNVNPDNLKDTIQFIGLANAEQALEKIKKAKPEIETDQDALKELAKQLRYMLYEKMVETPSKSTRRVVTQDDADANDDADSENFFSKLKKKAAGKEEKVVKKEEKAEKPAAKKILSKMKKKGLREIIKDQLIGVEIENWDNVEKFLKEKFPMLPVYRVKNVIETTNGKQAFGAFEDGALYLYENAEVGTVYHEVFEAVWAMFTSPEERQFILDEFSSREGSFLDRPTQTTIAYKDATPNQIKEQLAEELRDYFQEGIFPPKPVNGKSFIEKFFSDLATMIKNFFTGNKATNNTEKLFEKLGKGYYKKNIPNQSKLAFAKQGIIDIEDYTVTDNGELREKLEISDRQRNEIIQHMTYATLVELTSNDEDLFEDVTISGKQLYDRLNTEVKSLFDDIIEEAAAQKEDGEITKKEYKKIKKDNTKLKESVDKQWDSIVDRYKEFLKGYQIEFDENDDIQLRDEDRVKESDGFDATKIDNFKKANRAMKLLLATVPYVDSEGYLQLSSIGGARLVPVGQVYVSLLNNLSSSINTDDMIERLRIMAENDVNYQTLYKRITKHDVAEEGFSLSNLENRHSTKLITSLWKTFKKYNSAVRNVTILENGEVSVGEAHLSNAANQLRNDYKNAIITKAKEKKGYFVYSQKEKAYVGDFTKIKNVNLISNAAMVDFLDNLGVVFTVKELNKLQLESSKLYGEFKEAVFGIKDGISKGMVISSFTTAALNINSRLLTLGYIKAKISNPDFDSVFFNINGDLTQSYIGPNAGSQMYEFISSIDKLSSEQFQKAPQFSYLTTDVFSKGSAILKRKFTSKGIKKEDKSGELDTLMQTGYVGGTDNQQKGKQKSSAKLNYKERLVQELNLNLKGWYLNLVPGDSTLEHMTQMGNETSSDKLSKGMNDVYNTFKDYFIDELNMSREERPIQEIKLSEEDIANGQRQRITTDLRFFRSILENKEGRNANQKNKLHDDIIKYEGTPEEVYKKFEKKIQAALNNYIEQDAQYLINTLSTYNILKDTAEGFTLENIATPKNMNQQQLAREIQALTINYMIANIEFHKLIYSDPYQYADELKRVKSFNSPRQLIIGGQDSLNDSFNTVWNDGYEKGDIGYTDFNAEAFRTVTSQDVTGIIDIPGYEKGFTETDGGGIINMKAHRHLRIRSSDWNSNEEKQYRYDIAWEKRDKKLNISPREEEILKAGNPQVKSTYTPSKPIVSGNKADGNTYNDVVLDKFALYPLSYRIMKELNMAEESNAVKLYNKMQAENIDYIVFDSGRKVGAQNSHALYNKETGLFNDSLYIEEGEGRNIINVPFEIISIQSEVPSKDSALVRRGSQITKLITMDFMDAGVPVDYMEEEKSFDKRYTSWFKLSEEEKLEYNEGNNLYKEIKNNQTLLEAITEQGYESLLDSLGISDKNGKFEITDFTKVGTTLRNEILKREVNDNISAALKDFLDKGTALESTPAYQQVRNILYSIADKEVISPKMSGGMKVQIASTLLESTRAKEETINGKKGYTSDILSFYKDEDGKRVCEIMVGRWFESNMSDEDLLEYLNNTDEGKKILSGLAYRIPTQKQNSIDSFVIKKFLPKEFGDSVVIPAALVAKVGSDFDIDKLSIYFKNVFKSANGDIKLLPFYGYGQQAKNKFKELFISENIEKRELAENKLISSLNMHKLFIDIAEGTADEYTRGKWLPIIANWFPEQVSEGTLDGAEIERIFVSRIEKAGKKLEKLTLGDLLDAMAEEQAERWYKQSLENEYIQSGQNLVSHPKNFNRLIQPNSADQLKALGNFIAQKTTGKSFDYTSVGNMLNRRYMSRLRHAFVTGKYAIGIAAVNQTNHSLNQRQPIVIDPSALNLISEEDKFWLDDASIKFENYNKMKIGNKVYATLSKVKNAVGQDISDILGQFIDGYVDISKGPWIMELGATPNVASTFLFLAKVGVPIDTVAYFMNQPIIKDYLRSIENDGYSYLFMDSYVNEMFKVYGKGKKQDLIAFKESRKQFTIPTRPVLKNLVGKNVSAMNVQEKEQQRLMLLEFLKYAKLAEQMFNVTQGTNFDTATFNDPALVFKKQMQLEKARTSVMRSINKDGAMIPAVDAILDNSSLGNLAQTIYDIRNANATILKSDQKTVRNVIQKVLLPYIGLSDRDFVKVAQKTVADFFDWAVQTEEGGAAINKYISTILVKDGGITTEVLRFVNSIKKDDTHPLHDNHIINILQVLPSIKAEEGGANNIKIRGIENKVYDQNNIIYAFREIRDYVNSLDDNNKYANIYDKIRLLAVLQSGLSNSPISFTSVLPYEDFQDIYDNVLGKLENIPNLAEFYNLGVFERNNWSNDEMVPRKRAGYIAALEVYNPAMYYLSDEIQTAVVKKQIPNVLTQSVNNREGRFDYMTYSWEVDVPLSAEERKQGITQALKKSKMRAQGDYSFIKKGLFRKVVDKNNVPFLHSYISKEGELKEFFVYKAINAWGDSYRANEFYLTDKQSVIDNGYIKVVDVDNSEIIDLFKGRGKKSVSKKAFTERVVNNKKVEKPSIKDVQEFDNSYEYDFEPMSYDDSGYDPYAAYDLITPTETLSTEKINIYAGTRENAELSNFAVRPFEYNTKTFPREMIKFQSVEQAFQFMKLAYSPTSIKNESIANKILETTNGKTLRDLGKSFDMKKDDSWDRNSSRIMKELLLESFKQNPDSLEKLLATGNAELTHTQDKTKWGKEFPKLLMEVRQELRPAVSEKSKGVTLKDGNTYTADQLSTKMLLAKGYTLKEAGVIIKNNKC